MEESLVGLAMLAFYGLLAAAPIGIAVVHHQRLMRRLGEVGEGASLARIGHTPPWQTHGKGCTWVGAGLDREVRAELRMDPKRRIYAKLQVQRRRPLTPELALHSETYPCLRQFGFRSVVLRPDKGDLWRLAFVGGDRFSLLGGLNRWDPSRDKGAVPKETGNEVQVRLSPGWLELGYRGVTPDRMERLVAAQAALVDALEAEEDRPWREVVERYGLARTGDELRGEIEGRDIEVSCVRGSAIISVPCDTPLVAAHKDCIDGTRQLANPVLGMLIGVRGPPELDIDDLLDDEEVVGHLLAVVHAWPGSRVESGRIRLTAPKRIRLELADCIEHVVSLARMLEDR